METWHLPQCAHQPIIAITQICTDTELRTQVFCLKNLVEVIVIRPHSWAGHRAGSWLRVGPAVILVEGVLTIVAAGELNGRARCLARIAADDFDMCTLT